MSDKTFRQLYEQLLARDEIHQVSLPVPKNKLSSVLSEDNLNLHYDTLYKKYVENSHETGDKFFVAGAKLHTLFFEQLQEPTASNYPTDISKIIIDDNYGNFSNFRKAIIESALEIEGSGWVYMDIYGSIKTIKNHHDVKNIAFIIDMWEHAYIIDYKSDKEKYIRSLFKAINWSVINTRINGNV